MIVIFIQFFLFFSSLSLLFGVHPTLETKSPQYYSPSTTKQLVKLLDGYFFIGDVRGGGAVTPRVAAEVFVGSVRGALYALPVREAPKHILPPALRIANDFSDADSAMQTSLVVKKSTSKDDIKQLGTYSIVSDSCDNNQCSLVNYFGFIYLSLFHIISFLSSSSPCFSLSLSFISFL